MFKKLFTLVALLTVAISATTLTLQNGLNGYSGTEDVTIFKDVKSENKSWWNNAQYFGTPDDDMLVNTEFCC